MIQEKTNFSFATLISCDNNPQNVTALELDTDEHFLLTLKPVFRASPRLFEPKQVQTPISPNTFTAQEPGIESNVELKTFWNRVSFTKHSDNTSSFQKKPSRMTF